VIGLIRQTLAEKEANKCTAGQKRRKTWTQLFSEADGGKIPRRWFTLDFLYFFLRWFFRAYFRISAGGVQHIPSSPVIFAANQQSALDAFFVSTSFSREAFRNTFYLAKEKHFSRPWKKLLAHRHNTILVDADHDVTVPLQMVAACLKSGKSVVIFPEGTRSTDGSLKEFRKSFALLSSELLVPVVPVVIQGSLNALPKGRIVPAYGSRISIRFLPPVRPGNRSYISIANEVFRRIEDAMTAGEV
jgi:long-chain acyl-CoA synthetase